jgi:hypothetical protein
LELREKSSPRLGFIPSPAWVRKTGVPRRERILFGVEYRRFVAITL